VRLRLTQPSSPLRNDHEGGKRVDARYFGCYTCLTLPEATALAPVGCAASGDHAWQSAHEDGRLAEIRGMEEEKANPSPAPLGDSEIGRLQTLDIQTVRELWSRTYNTSGKPDWSHLYPYYHPDVVFQDSIQRIEGIKEFVALCERLTKRCESIQMEILSIAQDSDTILMDWIMTMAFKKYPPTPVYGSTKLTIHEDGRIIAQRDYFDLWGDILNGIPFLKKRYRSFMRRVFG
jgi:limonene-1,2-epoxide hydrolase